MKKVMFRSKCLQAIFLILFFLCFSPQLSYATAPKSVDLAYDAKTQTLSVTISHYTLAAGSHYIESVEIKKNGVAVSKTKYDAQPTSEIFIYAYKVSAAKGEVIEVNAACNLWGSKTSTLTVP
jgi:hypothetical protein